MLDIGEVSRQSGLPASALRFYEEKGLIKSVGRNGLRRVFDAGVVERLQFIALARAASFSLAEVAEMFRTDGSYEVNRVSLNEKADELDQRIKQLRSVRDALRHAAECPSPSHKECPKFQKLLRIAGSKRFQDRLRNS
ncbi:helix-turn-helix domain-containing protein [Roseiconus lacunae]|uniref:helix-turn-helix domain-containing protein n=1 Tax=Roseiconus lacunae TaxID=2605694 RepID=UPI0011F3924B|nr:helix-turn-helix domain-containing protein [Roseiconus lacunae]